MTFLNLPWFLRYLHMRGRPNEPLVESFLLVIPIGLGGAFELLAQQQFFVPRLTCLVRLDDLKDERLRDRSLVDGVLDHLHRDDLALHLVDGLAVHARLDRLEEFLHQEVAELGDRLVD
jgi:hypothetical protein